jgi:hypothetical protein
VLGPRFNSSEYRSMRVEDPVNMRGGLILGPALTLSQNPISETASIMLKYVDVKRASGMI